MDIEGLLLILIGSVFCLTTAVFMSARYIISAVYINAHSDNSINSNGLDMFGSKVMFHLSFFSFIAGIICFLFSTEYI